MARIYPLFSSSKGNASFIGSPDGGILIDAGVSYKKLTAAMELCGISISAVQGVFITHSHIDHIKGLKMLTKKTGVPVFGQRATLEELLCKECIDGSSEVFEINDTTEAAGMEITCFDTPHDTAASCGYRITCRDGRTCAVCTDLGCITPVVEKNITGCDLVLLEANYDEDMLKNGPYPYYLKKRIGSGHGHLSNTSSADQVRKLIESGTTRIILGHLSQENNTPLTAESTVLRSLVRFKRDRDYILSVAPVETSGETVVF